MEEELKCFLLLSLKEMALRTVVALSLSGSDALANTLQVDVDVYPTERDSKDWRERVEDVVRDDVSKLGLPKELTMQVTDLVRPIGSELRRWILVHKYLRNSSVDKPLLGWTSLGAIDDRKAAEYLVGSDMLSLERRYRIACAYCLEDSIRRLWRELPAKRKVYYSRQTSIVSDLAYVWPNFLSGELSSLNHLLRKGGRILTSFNQWGFEYSAEYMTSGNKFSMKYFFEKLTIAEKEDSLMRTLHVLLTDRYYRGNVSEVIPYLLTLITPEERKEIVRRHPINVLMVFLDWPLQDLFLENASLVWTFLSPDAYCRLLEKMSDKFHFTGHYCPKLFREFFIQSPPELKKRFANGRIGYEERSIPAEDFLSLFLKFEDAESIEVVFRNVEEEDRVKIVFDREVKCLFFWETIVGRGWGMVEVCLREATLSEEDRKRWKEGFKDEFGEIKRGDPEWKGFFDEEERGQKRKLAELLDGCSSEQ